VPVLKDAGHADTALGQLVIASSSVADFGAVVLLTLFFSGEDSGAGAKLVLLGGFGLLAVATALGLSRLGRSMRLEGVLVRMQDTTAEIRVRIAVLILVAFVALAEQFGLETILGAFLAGAILNMVDRDAMSTHPHFRIKLEAIGYGVLVPVFSSPPGSGSISRRCSTAPPPSPEFPCCSSRYWSCERFQPRATDPRSAPVARSRPACCKQPRSRSSWPRWRSASSWAS
jgi:hypothetical protein